MKTIKNISSVVSVVAVISVMGCSSPIRKELQGTSKTTYSEDKAVVANVKIPLKIESINSMKLKKSGPLSLDPYKKTYGKDWYDLVLSHFYMDGRYLGVNVTYGKYKYKSPVTKVDYSTNTTKSITEHPAIVYASILTPEGEELTEYKCDVNVIETTTRSSYDYVYSWDPVGAVGLAQYNCWADLIDQMANDVDQINQWNKQYITK